MMVFLLTLFIMAANFYAGYKTREIVALLKQMSYVKE